MENSDTRTSTKNGNVIVHVVQHLAPGGLETLVLEMLRFAKAEDSVLWSVLRGTKRLHFVIGVCCWITETNFAFSIKRQVLA